MEFRINKQSELPIYQQLKEQIKYFLLSGALQPGIRVPPPRELGEYLRINRNTVIAAYKELEQEGLLMTRHGQGTYVAEDPALAPDEQRKQSLLNLARETLERAKALGFQPEDLFTVVFNQTILGLELPETDWKGEVPRVIVVECNQPDADDFVKTFQSKLGIVAKAYILDELPAKLEDDFVTTADFAITNITHLEDVKAILEPLHLNVLAVMAGPQLKLFMEISTLPAGSRMVLVCACKEWSARMKRALDAAGIDHLQVQNYGLDDREELERVLRTVDYVYASRMAIDAVRKIAPSHVKVAEYFNEVDAAGLDMLRQYLAKLRASREEQLRSKE